MKFQIYSVYLFGSFSQDESKERFYIKKGWMNQNWQIVIFHVFANHFRLKYFQIFLLDN